MGDFLLDFRHPKQPFEQIEALRFFPDTKMDRIVRDRFALYVTRNGSDQLWAPFEAGDGVVVALAGRVALTASEWQSASNLEGIGGLACKAIYQAYRQNGVAGLTGFSGGYAIHVYDPRTRTYHLVNDRGGSLPCYATTRSPEVLSSHPDVLAEAVAGNGYPPAGSAAAWDLASMAQFIATGVVSFPNSYYRHISALEFGCIHSFVINQSEIPLRSTTRYASWQVEQLSRGTEDEIAERLADAIAISSRLRTLPILGRTAIALSGGLDSRTILCAAERHPALITFCAFDEQNLEFRSAKAIAEALGVKLLPFKRNFDYYGDSAELGVRISGGMGELASNHFLGFREKLRELGVENLVTGCYFDYLFKSLALDSREGGLLRRERFRAFSFQSYLPHFSVAPQFASAVRDRLDTLFPEADRAASTPLARARNAMRRIFPLYHEGDNAQRLVPQRVLGWFAPSVDPDILDLCRTTPPEMKLNKRVFRKAVLRICGESISRIPDNNTGLPVSASSLRVGVSRYRLALRRRLERRRPRLATEESWPNWPHYIRTSDKLRALWQRRNPMAHDVIAELCGKPFQTDVAYYGNQPSQYFMRLLTLKVWLDQRTASEPSS